MMKGEDDLVCLVVVGVLFLESFFHLSNGDCSGEGRVAGNGAVETLYFQENFIFFQT